MQQGTREMQLFSQVCTVLKRHNPASAVNWK